MLNNPIFSNTSSKYILLVYDSVTENRATGSHLRQPAGSQFGQTSFFITAHILTTENLDSENVTPRGLGEDGFWAERNVTNSGEEAFKY